MNAPIAVPLAVHAISIAQYAHLAILVISCSTQIACLCPHALLLTMSTLRTISVWPVTIPALAASITLPIAPLVAEDHFISILVSTNAPVVIIQIILWLRIFHVLLAPHLAVIVSVAVSVYYV